ncbi:hypothetical protein [Halosolutus halophilus]|uniref:hypothetical protein n=1 Tax=Halosolutus halophilus TaxID=1552990 RepID=UPI00223522D5|nr:hypothetical protein [Halosolutus halophilus]
MVLGIGRLLLAAWSPVSTGSRAGLAVAIVGTVLELYGQYPDLDGPTPESRGGSETIERQANLTGQVPN